MPATTTDQKIRVGTMEHLRETGCIVVRGADRPIAVFHDAGRVFAVDNRCPHMGFPLNKGTISDGMITCHWHHARFDAASGCTFDLFADNVPAYDVEVQQTEVFVCAHPRRGDAVASATSRLDEGLHQNIGLISAKAILALRSAGVDDASIVRQIARFGLRNRDGWGPGMVVLASVANLLPNLGDETAYLALYHAARRVAADCAGQAPRRDRHRLETDSLGAETLRRWLIYWTTVRHRDGAERTLLTALHQLSAADRDLIQMLFAAATERFYADTGHVVDFANKAFELLDAIGPEHADEVLAPLLGQLVAARGGEEMNAWRHPIDLVPLIEQTVERLPENLEGIGSWRDEESLADRLLGDDPVSILGAIADAADAGARPAQLSKALAYAAGLRVARFGTANEQGDWIGAVHSFSYCNAMDRVLERAEHPGLVRGVLHGAVSVYLNRFLNVPAAKLPHERSGLDDMPMSPDELRRGLLEALDNQHQVDGAARLVARYLTLGHPEAPLLDTLVFAVLREDFDFHSLQMVEAAIRQYRRWGGGPQGRNLLVAAARYLAAHSPTQRAQLQTSRVALRLHRGEYIYEDE